jgi:titin
MPGHRGDRVAAREWERAVLFGLVEPPSRRRVAIAALRRFALAIPVALLTMFGAPAAAALANTYFVSNANDSGQGSLRAAIQLANSHAGADTITVAPGVGQLTIEPQTPLPPLTDKVTVNGDGLVAINDTFTRGYALTLARGSGGSTLNGVTVYGGGISVNVAANLMEALGIYYYFNHNQGKHGLVIQSGNNTVRRSTVFGIASGGIVIHPPSGGAATGNLILGNTIGTDAGGDGGLGNLGGGVLLLGNASNNTIGGSAAGDRNVISGNGQGGVLIEGTGTTGNLVEGNTIGLTPSGSSPLPNMWGGVLNLSTGNDTLTLNTIAGNTDGGLLLNGKGTSNNLVQRNFIGTDSTGDGGLGNGGDGIVISGGGTLNLVGGGTAGDRNVISGNRAYGVLLTGAGTGENTLQGDSIGTTPSSSAALPNQWGVGIEHGAVNDTVTSNTVSGNADGGFLLTGTGTSGNVLQGNTIGLGAGGAALGNGGDGVTIEGGATLNTLGGSGPGQGNRLGFNLGGGVLLSGSTTTGDALLSNLIFSSGPNRSGPGITLAQGANGESVRP